VKSLLSGFRENAPEAIAAIREHHPKPSRFQTLRDAQLVVARQYGFAGWPELCAAVEAALDSARSAAEMAELFADLACLCYTSEENVHRRERAARLLAERPELTAHSIFAAAAAFDTAALRRHLESDAAGANQTGGPRKWPPLMYLGYSRVAEAPPARNAVEATRLLLDHNADPRFYMDGSEGLGGWRWTALTGVIGEGENGNIQQPPHPRARELAEMLLDAGADPNDSQALYNCHFTPGNEWLELLLSRGLTAESPCDPGDRSQETILDFQLAAAVGAGYVDRVRLLLEHGANARGRDDRYTQRSYVENAVLRGHGDILALLVAHGADRPELSDRDRFRMAVVRGDEDAARPLMAANANLGRQPDLLLALAQQNRLDAVRLLLDLGTDPNAMAMNGQGALHAAAWSGHQEMIELLMDRGARLDVRSRAHGGTAVGYAHHAGRLELRDWLLERSQDVFDLVAYGRTKQFASLLAEPGVANKVKENGAKLAALAKENGDTATLEVLRRHGVVA
jgi:ankyrin repeat protein